MREVIDMQPQLQPYPVYAVSDSQASNQEDSTKDRNVA